MWQINEVVLFDNDPYRILAIEDGQVVWMQISADKGVPQARAELLLMQYLDEGRLVRTDDPYVHLDLEEPSVDSVSFQKREEIIDEDPGVIAGVLRSAWLIGSQKEELQQYNYERIRELLFEAIANRITRP